MNDIKVTKIYLDMDGVIADFEKRYVELFGITPEVGIKMKKTEYWNEFIDDRHFASLPMMQDAKMGLDVLKNLSIPTEILSSTANKEMYEKISQQKREWLQHHNINFTRNFVPGKDLKYHYATPDSIIIDDTPSVIEDWVKAGGIGILHKNWANTLEILRKYV